MEVTESKVTTEIAKDLSEDVDSNQVAERIETPVDLLISVLGFKMNHNVILVGDDQLIRKWNDIVIGVAAHPLDADLIFEFFESKIRDGQSAQDYALLGLDYIKKLKLNRTQDIALLVGDGTLALFRVNKAGILSVEETTIAIGNDISIANVEMKGFPADEKYRQVVKMSKLVRKRMVNNTICGDNVKIAVTRFRSIGL